MMKFEISSLRNALTARRTAARLTQDDVAARIGCNRKWVSKFERGLSAPSMDFVVAYAELMGVGLWMDAETPELDLMKPIRLSNGLSEVSGNDVGGPPSPGRKRRYGA